MALPRVEVVIGEQIIDQFNNVITTGNTMWLNGTTLDLFPFESINLVIQGPSVKEIFVNKSTFSKSFVVPNSKKNAKIFKHYYDISIDTLTFSFRKKIPAYIKCDSRIISRGVIQLNAIAVNENKEVSYEVNFLGDTASVSQDIGSGFLTDMSFSAYNHTLTFSSITNSWTANTPYFYSIKDFGYNWNIQSMKGTYNGGKGLSNGQFFPDTKVQPVVKKIFSGINWNVDSYLIDHNPIFNRLHTLYNGNKDTQGRNQDASFASSRMYRAQQAVDSGITSTATLTNGSQIGIKQTLQCSIDNLGLNFDKGNLYSGNTYTANTAVEVRFGVVIDYFLSAHTTTANDVIKLDLYKNGVFTNNTVSYSSFGNQLVYNTRSQLGWFFPWLDGGGTNLSIAQAGDRYSIDITYVKNWYGTPPATGSSIFTLYSGNTFTFNEISTRVLTGQILDYNQFVPKNIKTIDYLRDIFTAFNAIIVPSNEKPRTLIIENRDYFYATGRTLDWSSKLDKSKPINQKLLVDNLDKRIILKFKEGKSWLNTNYQDKQKRTYGQLTYTQDNDYNNGELNKTLLFSPVVCDDVPGSNSFIIPKLGKLNNSNSWEQVENNLKLGQIHSAGTIAYDTNDHLNFEGVTMTKYPWIGILDHPFTGTTAVCFDTPDYSYYTLTAFTSNNLTNLYWKKFLDESTDKDSRMISCYLNLDANDVADLRLSDSIYLSGITESSGGYYFTINKLEYSPTSYDSSKIELIKLKRKFVQRDMSIPMSPAGAIVGIGPGAFVIGGPNSVSSPDSLVVGINNTLNGGSNNSAIIGTSNEIGGNSDSSVIMGGDSNNIGSNSKNSFIGGGSGNKIEDGVSGSSIVGGTNITATTNNTLYSNNIFLTGTINGISVSTITASTVNQTLWSASTGFESIIEDNGMGNLASGILSLAGGSGNTASGSYSIAFGGRNNFAI